MDEKDINLRSEEVQEVLGRIPAWILRWGITMLFIFMLVMLIGSAMFKYPDMVATSMTLTGTVPVGKVMAKSTGRISEMYVVNNQEVHVGDYLAIIENSAITKDVIALKEYLANLNLNSDSASPLPSAGWDLGEMQKDYIQFYSTLQNRKKNDRSGMELEMSLMRLQADINNWEKNYILVSPVDGKIVFTNYWSTNQIVSAGNIVFNIIPSDKGDLIGKALLPIGQSGKVKVGQPVNIHFDNFPDNEFGVVKGVVRNISLLPSEGFYIVDISFPNGLMTTYKKELPCMIETSGKADIITEDISLLERFFMPLKKVFSSL